MLHATNNTFANIPYYGCLPMMQTNFGGDLQLCTIEPYAGYNIGYNLNPVAQQTWGGSIFNPGAATCYAANPFSNGGCSSTPVSSGIPTPGTQGFNDAVRRGASQIEELLK
ncbi:unknown [Clostridium sp. CAG:813]|nr:unknown [Clostridium sp. CAG:813]